MVGKRPNTGTPKDMRLKVNKPAAVKPTMPAPRMTKRGK